jgi:nicotinate-nucleotide adenylyltransferase
MRLGVFGGTFDPVHVGHLILAEQCREQGRLDLVLFVPAARPPHKEEGALTPFDKRVEMLKLAISGQPAFRALDLEKDRPGPSYTVETLTELKTKYAGADLLLIMGSDTLHDLPHWHQPASILNLAGLLVAPRPGWAMIAAADLRQALGLEATWPLNLQEVTVPVLDISSRDLRRRLAEGRSVRYLIPRAVEAYIEDKGLYR